MWSRQVLQNPQTLVLVVLPVEGGFAVHVEDARGRILLSERARTTEVYTKVGGLRRHVDLTKIPKWISTPVIEQLY